MEDRFSDLMDHVLLMEATYREEAETAREEAKEASRAARAAAEAEREALRRASIEDLGRVK